MRTIVERSPIARRAVAVVLAVALGSGGLLLAASPTGAADPPSEPTALLGGSADWGIKASFRAYVTGPVANGTITTSAGATANPDGSFHFGEASGTVGGGSIDAGFVGAVRFVGHEGALDMTVADLRVEASGDAGSLHADVVSKSLETGDVASYTDVAFATLDLAGVAPAEVDGSYTWTNVPATLTAAGATAFADFYAAGTALDPITFTLDTGGPEPPSSPTTPSTSASTVSTTPSTTAPVAPEPSGSRTRTGPNGQRVTVTPANHLDPDAQTVTVTGEGYDPTVGIYLAFCVDQGPGVPPSPCLGGVDLEGASGASVWISSNPPPYGVGIAQPYGPGGTFSFDLTIAARDTDDDGNVIVDCLDGVTSCVVATRADHTDAGNRSADVMVPVYFQGQAIPDEPPITPSDPEGQPTPSDSPSGTTPVAVSPNVASRGSLPSTGADNTRLFVGLGAALVVVGACSALGARAGRRYQSRTR